MATTIINPEVVCEMLKQTMNAELIEAAGPVIDEALQEIEKVMRKRLATIVIAHLDNYFEVERRGSTLKIVVHHIKEQNI